MNQCRQGDLYFVRVDSVPDDAVPVDDNILAHGEATGHAHRVVQDPNVLVRSLAGIMYVHALDRGEAQIVHEEHAPITLPPGNWKVIRQREYTPEGWRQVAD